jgi:hypothetical protein
LNGNRLLSECTSTGFYLLGLGILVLYLVLFVTRRCFILKIAVVVGRHIRFHKDFLNASSPSLVTLLVLVFFCILELNSDCLPSEREMGWGNLNMSLGIFCNFLNRLGRHFFCLGLWLFGRGGLLTSLAQRFNLLSQFLNLIRLELASLLRPRYLNESPLHGSLRFIWHASTMSKVLLPFSLDLFLDSLLHTWFMPRFREFLKLSLQLRDFGFEGTVLGFQSLDFVHGSPG